MFSKTIYKRDPKGRYYAGISQKKAFVFAALFIFLAWGFINSIYGLGRDRSVGVQDSGTVALAEYADKRAQDDLEECQATSRGTVDCTSAETKARIYELTEGGKKPLKWYGKTVTATVTAYTSRVEETDATPCIAADGSDICERYAKGERICASNDYKLGTVLDIRDLGRCVVSDRMNKRYTGTGRIDWYMGHDLTAARAWGARSVSVSLTNY